MIIIDKSSLFFSQFVEILAQRKENAQ